MCMAILSACISVHHVDADPFLAKERESDVLALELQVVVSHGVGAGNQSQVL